MIKKQELRMEPVLYDMIKSAELPELVPVRRKYVDDALVDIPRAVRKPWSKAT